MYVRLFMYINNYTTTGIEHTTTIEQHCQVCHHNGNKMWNLVVSIVLIQICWTTSMNPFYNSFSQNYTYKTYHTYTFGFENLPQSEGGEPDVRRPVPADSVPIEIPAFIQEQLRRQNIPIPNSSNMQQIYHFAPHLQPNQNQDVPSRQISNNQQNQYPSPFEEESVDVPQPNLINQPGFRKSREDTPSSSPTPVPPNIPTPPSIVINSSSCYYGFCENVTNYPEDAIRRLLSNNNAFEAFFRPKVPDISERFNNEFENLCTVTKIRLFPKTATNLLGITKIVINVEGRIQAVDSEECSDDAKCRFAESWPVGNIGKCVQRHVQIPLAVMDEENQKIETDNFSYPSGCYCACKSG